MGYSTWLATSVSIPHSICAYTFTLYFLPCTVPCIYMQLDIILKTQILAIWLIMTQPTGSLFNDTTYYNAQKGITFYNKMLSNRLCHVKDMSKTSSVFSFYDFYCVMVYSWLSCSCKNIRNSSKIVIFFKKWRKYSALYRLSK